ncbi:tol-pal system-associated acyl-CoA thioesterase [Emcibacter nanhaiensis]|uniref:Tol-pal system-associated acyl-CoA thioesterase n=1 Tax=Emcibacter nanhaiensis TaxID=1505037 RepID=A0A501PPT4_9PROT|nr:tol-pal system-associated acyl-CoA thioesterase [Emcibacter nanhaiensis]TPD61974.1 tol-pal system-associated acyl-CoA thioesterase [Emcibacter nanhaiensis]
MTEISPQLDNSLSESLAGRLDQGVHILPVRVYYEDTDAGGIVYYANYLKYLERGRSDMLRLLGVDQMGMLAFEQDDDVQFVVRRAEVDYISPARLDEVLTVRTVIEKAGGASLIMGQKIYRGEDLLVSAVIKAGVLGKAGRPVRLPEKIKKLIEHI